MENIIFLDIDGVLNSECYFIKRYRNMKDLELINMKPLETDSRVLMHLYDIDPNALKMVIEIVNNTSSKIVIISSWKRMSCYESIKECLIYLGLPIIGETKDESIDRGIGIKEYLNKNNKDNYIILDDEIFPDYDEQLLLHLVKTDFKDGITREEVDKSIKLLKAKTLDKNKH